MVLLYFRVAPCLHLFGLVFNVWTPQTAQISNQPELGGPAPEQVRLPLLFLGRQRRGSTTVVVPVRLRRDRRHALARPAEHLVHAGQDLLGGAGERQVEQRDVVGAQPARRLAQARDAVRHLAHAHHHERGEHVAGPAKVALEHGEVDLEQPRLAG